MPLCWKSIKRHESLTKSNLEEALALQIKLSGLLPPVREYRLFAELVGPGRNLRKRLQDHGWKDYRYDFAWPEEHHKLLAEIQGGIWMSASGHNTGVGLMRDYNKNNAAVIMGWRVLYFTAEEIQSGKAFTTIEKALEK